MGDTTPQNLRRQNPAYTAPAPSRGRSRRRPKLWAVGHWPAWPSTRQRGELCALRTAKRASPSGNVPRGEANGDDTASGDVKPEGPWVRWEERRGGKMR